MRNRNACCSFCHKNHRDVGPLVEGPGEVYICGECIELCQSIIEQDRRRRQRSCDAAAPTPDAIQARLDHLIDGQEQAKRALALAAHWNCDRSDRAHTTAVLLLGPARSSKLLLARALAQAIEVPFAEEDLRGITPPEADSASAMPLLYRLLEACDFDAEAAQRGIVYVDGIDRRDTQEALLRLWQRGKIACGEPSLQVDVTRPLFLCGGAFARQEEVIARLVCHAGQPAVSDVIRALGMKPDLASHVQAIAPVEPLDEATLARIVSFIDFGRASSPHA
jgi:ATP-dependent Clp protease ATP-binding subunit ClpX